jgi:hypothetical protein
MNAATQEIFPHVRVLMGIVVSLGIARLLSGAARFVQHPSGKQLYWVHLGWVASMLLSLIHFWWWEFWLASVPHWTFGVYFLVILYAISLFLLSTLLFPDHLADYANYEDYFFSRRRWFFGLLALTFLFDVADTLLKGYDHLASFGVEYPIRIALSLLLCGVAIFTDNRCFHRAFIIFTLIFQVFWILSQFNTLQ